MFTDKEIDFLNSQGLGRLATVGADGSPHNVPLGFRLNFELCTIDIIGRNMVNSLKFRHIEANPQVALVVDEVVEPATFEVRGVEIRGVAQALFEEPGRYDGAAMIRITPTRIIAWGIDAYCLAGYNARNVITSSAQNVTVHQ